MTPKEQYVCVIANDTLKKSDVIILLEGDGLSRVEETARLYRDGWAPRVLVSGGVDNPPHSVRASQMVPSLIQAGVPQEAIEIEERSQHTRDQAVEIATLAENRGWKKIIMVASHYHQYRAYLTLLRGLMDRKLHTSVELINMPARDLPWFANDIQGRRIDLLEGEFARIEKYAQQGHLASYEEALNYQIWKESQP